MAVVTLTVVNDARPRTRAELGRATASCPLSCVEIAEALCGTVSCYAEEDGTRRWHGLRNIYGFHPVEFPRLEAFLNSSGLEDLADLLVPASEAGSMNSRTRRILYYVAWHD